MRRVAVCALLFPAVFVGGCGGDTGSGTGEASATENSSASTSTDAASGPTAPTGTDASSETSTGTGDGEDTTGAGDAQPELVWEDGPAQPFQLVVSDTHLYWSDNSVSGLGRWPLGGGAVEYFGDEFLGVAHAPATSGADVFWIASGTGEFNAIRYSPASGSGEFLGAIPGFPRGAAMHGDDFIVTNSDASVYRFAGGQGPISEIVNQPLQVSGPCWSPNGVVWMNYKTAGDTTVMRLSGNTTVEELATVSAGAGECVSDGPVYLNHALGIAMVDEAGGAEVYPFEVVSGVATALALGPTNVYFTDMTETIWAMRRSDQTLQALTVRDSEVRDILFHEGRIYWSQAVPGQIWSLQVE